MTIGTGTIILHAPCSTGNRSGERDLEMHQVRKGRQWNFGMKTPVGVGAETKLIHSIRRDRGQRGRLPYAGPTAAR